MYNPVSTYRIQFNNDFNFADLSHTIDFIHKMGYRTIYASPIFTAKKGSNHGYDITNPFKINPELGNDEDLENLSRALKKVNMGWVQDIVPNHMAYSVENPWVFDVLEKGKASAFYSFFDRVENHPLFGVNSKLMLPFFGKPIHQIIGDGELKLTFDDGRFYINYFDSKYPVSAEAYSYIFGLSNNTNIPECIRVFIDASSILEDWESAVIKLNTEFNSSEDVKELILKCTAKINSNKSELKQLVKHLSYSPVYWKETEELINYRRFFTINGLICLNIHKPNVYETYHKKIFSFIKSGLIQGLRIDHIDGLFDPEKYLERLRSSIGKETYLCIEKILEADETLPSKWEVEGTTGYDFLAAVNKLLANSNSGNLLSEYYQTWSFNKETYHKLSLEKKEFILKYRMSGELINLTHECMQITAIKKLGLKADDIKEAIAIFLVFFPQYRLYQSPSDFSQDDINLLKNLLSDAKANSKNSQAVDVLSKILEQFLYAKQANEKDKIDLNKFFLRCMQFTGPLMAKGVEDTLSYSYNVFIAHNDVGDASNEIGYGVNAFHQKMANRQLNSPLTMNCTSTHDTKRGEDARARLNVLSDIPIDWVKASTHWRNINEKFKTERNGAFIPTSNDEYFIYQTLVGHLPMDGVLNNSFKERLNQFIIKALREAKENTSWSNSDENYEFETINFIGKILSSRHSFLKHYLGFMKKIVPYGIINSISQVVIKNMAPGVPDTFQGCEGWNLSFVDPDNRREVDYKQLSKQLEGIIQGYEHDPLKFSKELWKNNRNSEIKQFFTWLTLNQRSCNPDLFLKGRYIPVKVKGRYKKHVISFIRQYKNDWILILLPLNTAELPNIEDWKNTRLCLPDFSPFQWENLVTKEEVKNSDNIKISTLFKTLPFALLKNTAKTPERRAGVLMHVSSLPGKYGIGDLGKEARNFIDLLNRTGQQYWQLLPLNITSKYSSHSPYSSYSAFAGNILFIDPEWLINQGLIDASCKSNFNWKAKNKTDFSFAEKSKNYFIEEAFVSFIKLKDSELYTRFETFKDAQKYWLHDFALFMGLKKKFKDEVWCNWPKDFRDRDKETLQLFEKEHEADLNKIKFAQFVFNEQWQSLKAYSADRNVQIVGDVPIYVSYDSADVWANSHIFKLTPDKKMEHVAGVPPDYFNANGQLWGMPVFNWQVMENKRFKWWINRLHRNLEWFDLLRLDHFRGFSAFWEVSAKDDTAINGKWVEGPGSSFFDVVKEEFPNMPFIAEDLGQIDQPVYDLRDKYQLPGMKVVQFGFEENMAFTTHAPNNHTYNSIVYTGTHDNNTMRGWFNTELDKATRKRFKDYTGLKLKANVCHLQMIRIAYASTAKLVIIPLQDWLGLDGKSRMNFPSTTDGNWQWMLTSNLNNKVPENEMKRLVKLYGRY
jgi:malto-oligosyltrehalose synthase/4-alpha-glucanotransferase